MFEQLLRSDDPKRGPFIARLFGIFSEEITRVWCSENARYSCLPGKPTVHYQSNHDGKNKKTWRTLDFALRNNKDRKVYIAEQKCELVFEEGKRLCLRDESFVERYRGIEAFGCLLDIAKEPNVYEVTVGGRAVTPSGAILIVASATREGMEQARRLYGFADILTIENMLEDMHACSTDGLNKLIDKRKEWCCELFSMLKGELE